MIRTAISPRLATRTRLNGRESFRSGTTCTGPPPEARAVFAQRRHAQSGMLPCFLRGLTPRLLANISSAAINRGRVSEGWMTALREAREAAKHGLLKCL